MSISNIQYTNICLDTCDIRCLLIHAISLKYVALRRLHNIYKNCLNCDDNSFYNLQYLLLRKLSLLNSNICYVPNCSYNCNYKKLYNRFNKLRVSLFNEIT